MILLSSGACSQPNDRVKQQASVAEPTLPADLQARAAAYWEAKKTENWTSLYDFLDPVDVTGSSVNDYVAWAKEKEPFQIQSYQIQEVLQSGKIAWVHVTYRTTLRRFPNINPQDAEQWQKWRVVQDRWYPVRARELADYPEPPVRRDAAAESELRERFLQSWSLRKDRNWDKLYEFTDPRDHSSVYPDEFATTEGAFEYLDCEIIWVEVIGADGRVRVRYHHKVNDPNLTKLGARDIFVIEDWIKVDGQWYRDLVKVPR